MAKPTKAHDASDPAFNGALVSYAFQEKVLGAELCPGEMFNELAAHIKGTAAGDLSNVEGMLVSQANALQSVFTNLAMLANQAKTDDKFERYLNLAFKAQSQSRATISTLIDLKFPRQPAVFARNANINNGQQQINNGAQSPAQAAPTLPEPNKLLEQQHGEWLDAGTQGAHGRADQALETVGAVNRTAHDAGKDSRVAKRLPRRGTAKDARTVQGNQRACAEVIDETRRD
jgi:hypothetical protein